MAIPATAATVVVPSNVSPGGFVPITIVTLSVKLVATFPRESWMATTTDGVMAMPSDTVPGETMNTSRLAGAGMTPKLALVTAVKPAAVAESV